MMKILFDIKNSIYSPEYYNSLLAKPFSYSLKYFFVVAVLIAFLTTAMMVILVGPEIYFVLKSLPALQLDSQFPEELQITIKDGVASSNNPEPYFIKFPPEKSFVSPPTFENILVIDTKTDFNIEKFYQYKTAYLLTRDNLIFGDRLKITIQPLKNFSDMVVTKSSITTFGKELSPVIRYIVPVLSIIMAVVVFGGILIGAISFNLIFLLPGAFMVLVIAKSKKVNINYKKAYQLSLHAITASLFAAFLTIPLFYRYNVTQFLTSVNVQTDSSYWSWILSAVIFLSAVLVNVKPTPPNSLISDEEKN